MKIAYFLSSFLLLVFSFDPCDAQGGGRAGAFLLLVGDAGNVGMGGTSVATPDHGSVLTANPAGIAFLKGHGITASYRFLSLDRRHSTISYTQGIASGAGVGFGWVSAGVGDIEGRDLNGRRTGSMSDNENAFLFAFSRKVGQYVAIGVTLTYLSHQLGGASAKGFGLDLGMIGRPAPGWIVGAVSRGLGARLSWQTPVEEDRSSQTKDEIPIRWALGVTYTVRNVLIAGEGEWAEDTGIVSRTGVSWKVLPSFMVMAGMGRSSEENGGITSAFGCAVRHPDSEAVELRYAYSNDALDAGGGHVFTVIIAW